MEVVNGYASVTTLTNELKEIQSNEENEFARIFRVANAMAVEMGKEIKVPRVVGRQLLPSNVESNLMEEYWQRVVFLPYLDCLMNQLEERFKGPSNQVIKAYFLIPSHLNLKNDAHLEDIKATLESDMPSLSTISHELRVWKRHWQPAECEGYFETIIFSWTQWETACQYCCHIEGSTHNSRN